jgi:hypothetical protein
LRGGEGLLAKQKNTYTHTSKTPRP